MMWILKRMKKTGKLGKCLVEQFSWKFVEIVNKKSSKWILKFRE
nr:MAG TPA: hypothetical protein [Bacteriophage sp.]